ncbi:MAG: hypothetical protein U5R06_20170 [candidate division KSB1 bacterium]|nr:hypothetical protein [candidate division KSB1 bacterium]
MKRIITHADFDGVVCAALCSKATGINYIMFTQPRLVAEARISITKDDIVCDLPYPLECGLWFDHHEGNLEELKYRNIDPSEIKGEFALEESCARVVFNYYQDMDFPDFYAGIVDEADMIDAFNYHSIEDWRRTTPGKILDSTIKLKEESADIKWEFLRNLVRQLRDRPIDKVANMPSVQKRYRIYKNEEERMLKEIKQDAVFLEKDIERNLIILDTTQHNHRPNILKHLAYLVYPDALAVLQISNLYEHMTKTNHLSFSMSLSLNMTDNNHNKNVGDIMRTLNLGGGHPGAGAGTIHCSSKDEMLKTKDRIAHEIYDLFCEQ